MRQTSTSKINVGTQALLAAVRKRREALVRGHEKETVAYARQVADLGPKVAEFLRKAADKAEAGDFPDFGYRSIEVKCRRDFERPREPHLDLEEIDRLIKTLEMASDDKLAISAADASMYLG